MGRLRKRKVQIAILFLLLISLLVSGLVRIHERRPVSTENREFIKNLGVGFNLGNALDVCDWESMFTSKYGAQTETLWWGPVITRKFIEKLADCGFGTVRLPVTYMNHIDENGNIDEAWLNRIGEVAGWVINCGMYCIVDIHHDTGNDGWIKASPDNYEANKDRVTNMIRQIAGYFNAFDDRLILEGFNEMVDDKNHWSRVPYQSLMTFNKWNQLFVETVRKTGGNNSERYLLINTYAASYDRFNIYYFEMPEDSADNRLIAGVHDYASPDGFDRSIELTDELAERGYPVIIGEFGTTASAKYDRAEYAGKFVETCREKGYCPIWWDNGGNPEKNPESCFALFDRSSGDVYFDDIVAALLGTDR